jgi:hypothetical protein
MSLRGGRFLPDEAIFSNVAEDCFAPAGLAMTKGAKTEETMGKGAMTKGTMKKGATTKGAMAGLSGHAMLKKGGSL